MSHFTCTDSWEVFKHVWIFLFYFFNGFLNGSLGCGPEHFWVFGFGPLWAHASLYLETFCHPLEQVFSVCDDVKELL